MSVNILMDRFATLSLLQQRAVCAIIGATVADAAVQPLHWIYDDNKLKEIIGDGSGDIFFWSQNRSPFHNIPPGSRSTYNDMAYVFLKSMPTDENLDYDQKSYVQGIDSHFSPDSSYAQALALRMAVLQEGNGISRPIDGPWQLGDITAFLKRYRNDGEVSGNPDSKESTGFASTVALTAKLALRDVPITEIIDLVKSAASVITSGENTLAHVTASVALLTQVIRHGASALAAPNFRETILSSVPSHLTGVFIDELEMVLNALETDEAFSDISARFGKSCDYPGAWTTGLLAILRGVSGDGFTAGVRNCIIGGGGSCQRANFAGAILGAAYGFQGGEAGSRGIPTSWLSKTEKGAEIFELALEKVVGNKK